MIRTGISVYGKTDMFDIQNVILMAEGYCSEILEQFVMLYVNVVGPSFILMDRPDGRQCPSPAY